MLRFVVLVIIVLVVLVGMLHAWQTHIPSETPSSVAVLLPDSSCVAPCWNGIPISTTAYKDLHNQLATLVDYQVMEPDRWQHIRYGHEVALTDTTFVIWTTDVRLGDIIAALGEPDFQDVRARVVAREVLETRIVHVYYEAYQLIVFLELDLEDRLSPDAPIRGVRYATISETYNSEAWRGYIPVASMPDGFP